LIALVAATVDQVGGFGVGAGDDDTRNTMTSSWNRAAFSRFFAHPVPQALAALVAGTFGTRTLVLMW